MPLAPVLVFPKYLDAISSLQTLTAYASVNDAFFVAEFLEFQIRIDRIHAKNALLA